MKHIIFATTILLLSACVPQNTTDPSTKVVSITKTALHSQLQGLARRAAASKLKDPSSAQFGGIQGAILQYGDGSKRLSGCGVVNAKNGFGAYTGNKMYLVLFSDNGGATAIMDAELLCRHYGIV